MEECRKQEELWVIQCEALATFTDATFAEDQNLLAAAQGIDHNGPFLKSNAHEAKLSGWSFFRNLCEHVKKAVEINHRGAETQRIQEQIGMDAQRAVHPSVNVC
jgi:hypothetical protein